MSQCGSRVKPAIFGEMARVQRNGPLVYYAEDVSPSAPDLPSLDADDIVDVDFGGDEEVIFVNTVHPFAVIHMAEVQAGGTRSRAFFGVWFFHDSGLRVNEVPVVFRRIVGVDSLVQDDFSVDRGDADGIL